MPQTNIRLTANQKNKIVLANCHISFLLLDILSFFHSQFLISLIYDEQVYNRIR